MLITVRKRFIYFLKMLLFMFLNLNTLFTFCVCLLHLPANYSTKEFADELNLKSSSSMLRNSCIIILGVHWSVWYWLWMLIGYIFYSWITSFKKNFKRDDYERRKEECISVFRELVWFELIRWGFLSSSFLVQFLEKINVQKLNRWKNFWQAA